MITIYCSAPCRTRYAAHCISKLTERELLILVHSDSNDIWFVHPHVQSVFKEKFIEEHLDSNGYVIEGVYHTELCGEVIEYRLIEDINAVRARNNISGTI